jgi:antirestriction protein
MLNQSVNARLNAACSSHSGGDNQAFFYIDGIPTKGLWVDLDQITGWEDVEEKLLDLFPSSLVDEILCADVEGLAHHFYASNCDSFGMDEWLEFLAEKNGTHLSDEVIGAYFENCGASSLSDVEEAYQGEYNSDEDFAVQLLEDTGELDPSSLLGAYFDYEKFARDLMMCDYFESNGHYFRNL